MHGASPRRAVARTRGVETAALYDAVETVCAVKLREL